MGNAESSQPATLNRLEETYNAVGQITFEVVSARAVTDTVTWPKRPSTAIPVYIAHRNYGSAETIAMGYHSSALTGNQLIKHWLCAKVRPSPDPRRRFVSRFYSVPEYVVVNGVKVHIVRPLAAQIRQIHQQTRRSGDRGVIKTNYILDVAVVDKQTGTVKGVEMTKDEFMELVDQDTRGANGWRQAKAAFDQDCPELSLKVFDVSYVPSEYADSDGEGSFSFDSSAPTTSAPLGARYSSAHELNPYSLEGEEELNERGYAHLFSNVDQWYEELCPMPFSNIQIDDLGQVRTQPSREELNHSHIMFATKMHSNAELYEKMRRRHHHHQ